MYSKRAFRVPSKLHLALIKRLKESSVSDNTRGCGKWSFLTNNKLQTNRRISDQEP